MPSHPTLLALLLIITFPWAPKAECSEPNTGSGMTVNCQSANMTDCHWILQFDVHGNLDIHIHDVVDRKKYVAIAVDTTENGTEYVIGIPHQRWTIRGIANDYGIVEQLIEQVNFIRLLSFGVETDR